MAGASFVGEWGWDWNASMVWLLLLLKSLVFGAVGCAFWASHHYPAFV